MAVAGRAWSWLRRNALPIYACLAVAYLLIPIVVIAVFSFGDTPKGKLTFSLDHGFTTEYWSSAFSISELNDSLLTSLRLAAISTAISTAIGTLMAIALVRHKFHGQRAANLLIVIPMATPEVVIGAALLSMFIYSSFALGFTTLLIAHVMFSISFVVVVTLPLLAPGILAAALLAFSLSIDDFVISNFNSGTTVTFPLYVYGVSLRGVPVQVNVLATMLFAAIAIAVLLVLWQQRRAERMAAVRPEPQTPPAPALAGGRA
jgi:spermidine/putrescine transport system permease protein